MTKMKMSKGAAIRRVSGKKKIVRKGKLKARYNNIDEAFALIGALCDESFKQDKKDNALAIVFIMAKMAMVQFEVQPWVAPLKTAELMIAKFAKQMKDKEVSHD